MNIGYARMPLDGAEVRYLHGPDSQVQDGVPAGTVTEVELYDSTAYPGTTHVVRVHVPAQYDPSEPASLVVFQDGSGFLDPDDDLRTGIVLDNLMAQGDLPTTIGVFVDPGVRGDAELDARGRNPQRNAEYDAFDDRYVTFLVDEVVPQVSTRWSITDDHQRWGIGGFSSGASCAFTAAWHRPDVFGRVICFSASFAQLAGGNPFPELIAQSPPKPLRVFLQVGHRDLGWDEPEDNWLTDTLRVGAALAEGGYDVRLVVGEGGHDSNHAGVLLPDALRWALGQQA